MAGRRSDLFGTLASRSAPAAPEPVEAPAAEGIDEVVVNADGGSRGNPGPSGIGAVVALPDGTILAEIAEGIGHTTNNVAEYKAVIAGLGRARDLGARRVRVRADSKLVIEQLKGTWKVRQPHLQPLREEAKRVAGSFERVSYQHVPREQNRIADALANQAMDAQAALRRGR
jgi:probable phosphoglycerate mutase